MTDTKTVAELAAKGTQGEWLYRPEPYDDWGAVVSGSFHLCQVRDPRFMDDDILAEHRKVGTDPWEANARRIANVPAMEALIADLSTRNAELEAENARLRGVLGKITEIEPTLTTNKHPVSAQWIARAALTEGQGDEV